MTKARLLIDKYSNKSNGKGYPLYASKNTIVTIISQHENVFCVKKDNGDTFSVRVDEVKIIE